MAQSIRQVTAGTLFDTGNGTTGILGFAQGGAPPGVAPVLGNVQVFIFHGLGSPPGMATLAGWTAITPKTFDYSDPYYYGMQAFYKIVSAADVAHWNDSTLYNWTCVDQLALLNWFLFEITIDSGYNLNAPQVVYSTQNQASSPASVDPTPYPLTITPTNLPGVVIAGSFGDPVNNQVQNIEPAGGLFNGPYTTTGAGGASVVPNPSTWTILSTVGESGTTLSAVSPGNTYRDYGGTYFWQNPSYFGTGIEPCSYLTSGIVTSGAAAYTGELYHGNNPGATVNGINFMLVFSQAFPGNVPTPPILSGVANGSTNSLQWTVPTGYGGPAVTSYSLFRGTTSGGETLLASGLTLNNYVDSALTLGQTYYYYVEAFNTPGNSIPSNEVGLIPPGPPLPGSIEGVARGRQPFPTTLTTGYPIGWGPQFRNRGR